MMMMVGDGGWRPRVQITAKRLKKLYLDSIGQSGETRLAQSMPPPGKGGMGINLAIWDIG
jgi:hypothetical protein